MFKQFLKNIGLFKPVKFIYRLVIAFRNIIRNSIFPSAIILTYHRVAVSDNDPHQLAVSPEHFYKQMQYLKGRYTIISLEQLIIEIIQGTVKRNMVVITFDDGYADNFYNALPILKELNIPATVFVSSGNIDKEYFYWDGAVTLDYGRPMTTDELKTFSADNLITIGGHTVSHPHIPTLNKEQKKTEIFDDRKFLQMLLGKDVDIFAFPFGEFDSQSIGVVKNAGYSCSCILKEQRVTSYTDLYHIPRFLVRDWNKDTFIKKMHFTFL